MWKHERRVDRPFTPQIAAPVAGRVAVGLRARAQPGHAAGAAVPAGRGMRAGARMRGITPMARVQRLLLHFALLLGCVTQLLLPATATAMAHAAARSGAGICSTSAPQSFGGDGQALHHVADASLCAVCAFATSGAALPVSPSIARVADAPDSALRRHDASVISPPAYLRPASQAPPIQA